MSRIIVKNLPSGVTEEKLRGLFGQKGYITDCSLKFTKGGVFRKFAFIGYKKEEEAEAAVKHFDKSFIKSSKIQVEFAKSIGDPNKPRAWSRYSKESSVYQKQHEEKELSKKDPIELNEKKKKKRDGKVNELLGDLKDDPEFQEFLEVHQSKATKAAWSNDVGTGQTEEDEGQSKVTPKLSNVIDSDSDSGMSEASEEEEEEVRAPGQPPEKVKKSTEKTSSSVSDLEYLKTKMGKSKLLADSSDEESEEEDSEDDDDDDDSEEEDSENDSKATQTKGEQKKTEPQPSSPPEQTGPRTKYLIKMKGLPAHAKEKQITEFFKPITLKEVKIPRSAKGKPTFVATVEFESEKEQDMAMGKNKNYIGPKKIFLHKMKIEGKAEPKHEVRSWEQQTAVDEEDEGIGESGRLYVRNLAYICKEEDLEKLFSKYGPLTEVHLPIDSLTKKVKGFAFITYMIPENAVQAYSELDGTIFQGRMLHILPGKTKKENTEEGHDGMTFKKKKEAKQKALAGSSHNWNSLFLGANAVADVMASKYGTSKSEILDAEQFQMQKIRLPLIEQGSHHSLGVRMALGETQVVSETRDFLIEQGVALDSFSQAAGERSKTVILVKNLPAGTKVEDLRNVFAKFGTLGRIILPPSGITAMVEYLEPSEARNGFRSLAYTKFQHVPLYLEWAPMNVFSKPSVTEKKTDKNEETTEENQDKMDEDKAQGDAEEEEEDEDEEEQSETGCTLFVKNLSWDTTEQSLKEMFKKCGKMKNVVIARKKDMKNPGNFLSMGYGFVEYKQKESAQKALKQLQHSQLDGHMLELKISNRATVTASSTSKKKQDPKKKQTSTKILIRNIPFQAKQQEVKELFSVFGELKTVRLPKKLSGTGSHRGFGFVDFLTKQDAKRAFNALCHSTHLYGRRLVLEWAETEENMGQIRKRTADHYHDDTSGKKLKKSSLLEELKGTA